MMKIVKKIVTSIIAISLMAGFFSYAHADETGEVHVDSPGEKVQEKSAKDMKMGEKEHEDTLQQVRGKYLKRVKKAQEKYTVDSAMAKKEKSTKKEQIAKKIFMKAKADAVKIYQKERNAAMKQAMKKKM